MAEGENKSIKKALDILEEQYKKDMEAAEEVGWNPQCATWCPNEPLYHCIAKLRNTLNM